MQNYAGKQIDRYRIIERLGMGGMAVVYKAYDTRLEREVALKLIRTESIPQDQHERLFKRFEREAKAQAGFSHRNIIPVFDYGEVDSSPYLVMALVSGGTLKERLNGPIHWQQAVRWLIPIAEALFYAHQHGIVHRDVKPGNILFDEDNQPILTDFGIAKVLETDEATLTGTGFGVGTPEYMAPEQWQGKTNPATDQYALGVVLYELITGQKPYTADTPPAVAILQATEPLQPPSNFVEGIPDTVEKILYKALAHNPQDRYESMDGFAKALRRLLTGTSQVHSMDVVSVVNKKDFSENVTYDEIDSKPIENPPKTPGRKNKSIAKWVYWTVPAGLIIIVLAVWLITGGNIFNTLADNTNAAEVVTPLSTSLVTEEMDGTGTQIPTKTTTFTPEPTLGIGSTIINEIDGAELIYIPAGTFRMGSESGYRNESPEHTVYLDAYWIYTYEVSNALYRLCVIDGTCSGNLSDYPDNNLPAINIDWFEASDYCDWAGGSLPTEAQWEKAARGTEGLTYPWGAANPTCNLTNYAGCEGSTMPVNSYSAGISPYGAFSMVGNVWEWVADWYEGSYYQNSPDQNPTGPYEGTVKVLRGGSWLFSEEFLRITFRHTSDPGYSYGDAGFRCIQSETP